MSTIPDFEQDVFISYAHVDNVPLSEGLRGWVETLHDRLKIRLKQLLGEEVSIWRDIKLRPYVPFPDEIPRQLTSVAIFISILSPRYCNAEWCLRELVDFCNCCSDYKCRIFKVVKTFVPIEQHPTVLQGLLGYEFFEHDEYGRPRELSSETGSLRNQRYWDKFEELAQDITLLISGIKRPRSTSIGKTVYLAETTFDLGEERDRIKRELQQHGYTILPNIPLPLAGDVLKETVREYLSRSDFSVHMIGNRYGIIPEGESKSVVQLQNDLAAERKNGFKRIVWMPVGLEAQEEAQQRLIDSFRHGDNGDEGVELLQTKLEDLKTFIHENITFEAKQTVDPNSVYLICDPQDLDAIEPIEGYLESLGINVILPAIEGEETQLMNYHKMVLRECDAVLIYYGRAKEVWLLMKQRELQKIAGYGRTTPLLSKGILIGPPHTDAKERVRDHQAVIIKNYEGFSPESLKPFLERLRQVKGAHK